MSGPVTEADAPAVPAQATADPACVEVSESHLAQVGNFEVRRALPRRGRRTVGAWCFADHMGPANVDERSGLDIGPHPHIGLQTVTWLIDGEVLHKDSLGSEQVIKPGQLNLMTAGRGVAHAEEATGHYRGTLEGIQLWIAQPDGTRNAGADFTHLADLPRLDFGPATATVLIGSLDGRESSARHDTDLVGVDLDISNGETTVPLNPRFEYAVVVLRGGLSIGGQPLGPGHLGYLGTGRDELPIATTEPTRALLIGGTPLDEPILMWWNFVARSRDELEAAYRDWRDGTDRFPTVTSTLPTIPAPPPYWL